MTWLVPVEASGRLDSYDKAEPTTASDRQECNNRLYFSFIFNLLSICTEMFSKNNTLILHWKISKSGLMVISVAPGCDM